MNIMKKSLFTILLATVLAAGALTGCGSEEEAKITDPSDKEIVTGDSVEVELEEGGETEEAVEEDSVEIKGTVTIAAGASPYAEILEQAKPLLAAKGWDLEVTIFDDLTEPNLVVENGEFDGNYFQDVSSLDSFNKEHGTRLVNAGEIHYEAFVTDPATESDPADISEEAVNAETNDTTEAKAYANIIAVKEGNEENEGIKALVEVLKSDDIRNFIENTYDGTVVACE